MAEATKIDTLENKLEAVENTVAKKRVHKLFGEYKKCKVTYKQAGKEKVSIFASINSYTVECQQDTEVEIPSDIIDILKEATYTTYFYNELEKNTNQKKLKNISLNLCNLNKRINYV